MSYQANTPTWIWYPGDYEIWLANKMNNRRTERGAFFPPFWKMDSHYVLVEFSKKLDLPAEEEVQIAVEGQYNVKLNGKLQFGMPKKITLPAGKHSLNIKVFSLDKVPAIYVKGKTFASDSSWLVTYEDKEWIDESGKASDQSGTTFVNAGSWNFHSVEQKPSEFKLETTPQPAVKVEKKNDGVLVDFGKETFGFITLHGIQGKGKLNLYYGESVEEALATETCETLDKLIIDESEKTELTLDESKAFRHVYITSDAGVTFDSVSMLYEYLPLEYKGKFRCSDELINQIWDISEYTMHLTTREFFIDGIKRDRWIWSGDAYQSFLMNYYLFFDSASVTRTLYAMRGKDPVTSHVNTIMDYTFYWFMGVYDYYQYTGDKQFLVQFYPRMQGLMDFVLARRNANGMMEGLTGDWVFLDWADFKMSKTGELSFEQLLFRRSLETMEICANIAGDTEGAKLYNNLAKELESKFDAAFWDESKKAYVHNRENGTKSEQVTPYTNMFGVLLDYFDEQRNQDIKKSVLMNPDALKITTPYMRFYELEALCALGEHDYVMKEMRDYWGGMLKLGATSFWEKYTPSDKGAEHLTMYGRPFGKSLCHAWGASPIYLLGKYYLGVKPTTPGYSEFSIAPHLSDLGWMEGSVPTPNGSIDIRMDKESIAVKAGEGKGYLYFSSKNEPSTNMGKIETVSKGQYRLLIEGNGTLYEVKY